MKKILGSLLVCVKDIARGEGLPTNSESIDRIQTGDIMLFGSDCLVLFYDDFSNSYSYTRISHIEDKEVFVDALGDGTVEVSFEAGE